jgi:hypothetical protein
VGDLIVFADTWVAAALAGCAFLMVGLAIARRQPVYTPPTRYGLLFLALLVLVSILAPMFGHWMGGRSLPNAVGGLLPWNDAAGYFNCARALADGVALDSFCQRRPHYTAYLTSLLSAAGRDLQLMLLIQALVLASGVFLFAKAISARWGFAVAIVAIAPLAAFAGSHSVTTLTENLGLVLGVVAMVFLLNGSQSRHIGALATGVFLLTLALSARAGALFVLPLLLLWPLLLPDFAWQARIRRSAVLLIAIIAGLAVGPIISALLGGDPGDTHANFSYTIFGVISGGKGWLYIYDVHPEFFRRGIPESQIARDVYAATWRVFLESPELAIQGLTKGFLIYLERILKYVPWLPARIFIVLCWLTGIVHILRHRQEPTKLMLGLIALGIATSAPIIAFDAGTRVYAATIAADATIVAIGFAVLANTTTRRVAGHDSGTLDLPTFVFTKTTGATNAVFALFLVLLVTLIPVAIGSTGTQSRHTSLPTTTCAPGSDIAVARLGPGSPVLPIVADGQETTWPASPAVSGFTGRMHKHVAKADGLRQATPGTTYLLIYDLVPEPIWVNYVGIAVDMAVPVDGRAYVVCSEDWPTGPLEGARRITSISPISR